ncbi:hypothetical protein ACFPM0_29080 [Pseudonocardia sulfidoxydans]|uniref:hypothetical protein n=1 Tax=Pseudonocardia sulfidoxydans TaxID=54011 RepID=UPI003613A149
MSEASGDVAEHDRERRARGSGRAGIPTDRVHRTGRDAHPGCSAEGARAALRCISAEAEVRRVRRARAVRGGPGARR